MYFQSPSKYMIFVIATSLIMKLPRFFHLKMIRINGTIEYWTTPIMDDPVYIRFSSYWDDLFATGALPLAISIFLNLKIYLKVYQWIRIFLRIPLRFWINQKILHDINFLFIDSNFGKYGLRKVCRNRYTIKCRSRGK